MNYLIVDTETKTLLTQKFVSFQTPENWPEIKQIAWQVYDDNGNILKEKNYFIDNNSEDSNIEKVINIFREHIISYKPILVGHNIDFDKNVIGSEFHRKNIYNSLIGLEYICTMMQTIEFCELPNYKFPRLQELYLN